MNLIKMSITVCTLLMLSLTGAHAGDRQLGGLIIGGGTGALVGQAIGRNTAATVVGATVGGVVGLIVGTELERQSQPVYHQPQVVVAGGPVYQRYPTPVFHSHYRQYPPRYHHVAPCRKIVTYHRGYYGHKKVVKTVCSTHHGYGHHYR